MKQLQRFSVEFSKDCGGGQIKDLFVRYTIANEDLSKSNILHIEDETSINNTIPLANYIENLIKTTEGLN